MAIHQTPRLHGATVGTAVSWAFTDGTFSFTITNILPSVGGIIGPGWLRVTASVVFVVAGVLYVNTPYSLPERRLGIKDNFLTTYWLYRSLLPFNVP